MSMLLERQVLHFLELEVFAAELYRRHVRHVPELLRPLMREFCAVEDRHIARFQELYTAVSGRRPPRAWLSLWVARFIAWTLAPFGWKTIFRFECWVEEKAVYDYQEAMKWLTHRDVREAIEETLRDEEKHAPYLETLQRFCQDEQHHIEEMRYRLDEKR